MNDTEPSTARVVPASEIVFNLGFLIQEFTVSWVVLQEAVERGDMPSIREAMEDLGLDAGMLVQAAHKAGVKLLQ